MENDGERWKMDECTHGDPLLVMYFLAFHQGCFVVTSVEFAHLSFVAYSNSIAQRSFTKLPYLSKNSIPLCVWAAKLSYWSCEQRKQHVSTLSRRSTHTIWQSSSIVQTMQQNCSGHTMHCITEWRGSPVGWYEVILTTNGKLHHNDK